MTDNAEVSAAIAQSRFNETVVLQVAAAENDDKKPREILLIACLDKDNGGIIWKDLSTAEKQEEEEEDGVDVGIVRHLRTKQWFFPMLNDHRRNQLYDQAIRAASQQAVRQFLLLQQEQEEEAEVMRVLDIGSGTGLLAMMAAKYVQEELKLHVETHSKQSNQASSRAQAKSVRVTSLEMSSAMSRLARLTIADNQLHDTIQVSEGHSTEHNYNDKIQFCVSELLESSLLQEGILPALRDAWERQLHSTAVMVPQRARVLGQLVEGSFLKDYWGPHDDYDNHNNSIRLCLSSDTTSDNNLMRDGGARGGFILPIHAEQWIMTDQKTTTTNHHQDDNNDNQKLIPLSDPFPIMDFDFSKPGALPEPEGRRLPPITIQPHTDGRVHAVLFWWELNLWQDLTYSTQHGREPWQDHWHQCLFVFTSDKEGYAVQSKTVCQLVACHNDTAMWFSMVTTTATNNSNTCDDVEGSTTNQNDGDDVPPPCKRLKQEENNDGVAPNPAEMPEHNPLISAFRACQLNNSQRQAFLQKGIRQALHEKGNDAVVLDVSDFALCAILAAKLEGATRVSSLESSTGGVIPTLSAKVAQLANGLPSSTTNLFQVLQCHAEHLSLELLNGMDSNNNDDNKTAAASPVQIVVGEPYYQMLEGWHLQEALNYFYLVRALQRRGILDDNFCSVPAWAVVKGCAIESASLKQAYGRCGGGENGDDKSSWICGFDHQQANCHGDRFHQYDLCLPMWEYEYRELTASFEIARLDYNNNGTTCTTGQEQQYSFSSRAPFLTKGTCDSVLVWVEYGVRVGNTDCFESHATLGRSYRQLVRMLRSPVVLDEGSFGQQELLCRFEFGNQKDLESYKLELSIGSI